MNKKFLKISDEFKKNWKIELDVKIFSLKQKLKKVNILT